MRMNANAPVMNRAFGPPRLFLSVYPGRCPGLVWQRAFGPGCRNNRLSYLARSPIPNVHLPAPKVRPYTSPGQRPGNTFPNPTEG